MRQLPAILRQVRRSSQQASLFILCVALSLATLTAFSGFSRSVSQSMQQEARSLHAADIVIRSYDPIPAPLAQAVDRLTGQGRVEGAAIHEFYSVVRAPDEKASVLASLKIVEAGYPFYGAVVLQSGRPFGQVLVSGSCIVEQTLLDRTGTAPGDSLTVGNITLRIADVVIAEPDRPLELFSFGPRIFIHASDLDRLGLMETGSRIRRIVLLKVLDPRHVETIADQLRAAAPEDGASIDTYRTARSAVKRFLDNFLFFLKLVGLFILLISGLGIQSTLTALINENQRSIAVMKAVGASGRFITIHFMLLISLLGLVGAGAGTLSGAGVQAGLAKILAPFLPYQLSLKLAWTGIAEALMLGFAVVALFSLLPLYRLREMRPVTLFNRLPPLGNNRWPALLSAMMVLIFFLAIVLWHMRDIRFGVYFVVAVTAMILTTALLTQSALWTMRRLPVGRLVLRQAVRGLFRRGNATRAILITLTTSLTVLFGDHFIERNLNATFVQSFPADSPTAFFVDIQPGQTDAFTAAIGNPVQFYPIIRARLTAVNGEAIDRHRERDQRRDNLARVFNLTYRERLLDDETLIRGNHLFRSDWNEPQVSVMDTVVDMRAMKIGDRLHFNIQGVPLTARISSIRTRDNRSLSPFFYFVFPPSVLEKAPQTLFAALRVAPGQIGPLQYRIVTQFPNVSVIDMSQTIGTFVRLMGRLARILRGFSLFSIAAGILILVSAVFATRAERVREAVYFKILGAGRRFVFGVFALENLLIGLLSSGLALIMAQASAWWVCTFRFDIGYRPFLSSALIMVGLTVLLTVAVGMGASLSILAKKPVVFLREQQNG